MAEIRNTFDKKGANEGRDASFAPCGSPPGNIVRVRPQRGLSVHLTLLPLPLRLGARCLLMLILSMGITLGVLVEFLLALRTVEDVLPALAGTRCKSILFIHLQLLSNSSSAKPISGPSLWRAVTLETAIQAPEIGTFVSINWLGFELPQ
jgi:hypothetical protein